MPSGHRRHRLAAVAVALAATVAGALAPTGGAAGTAVSLSARAVPDAGVPSEARFPVDGPSVARAREISDAHWGAAPCGGEVELRWTPLEEGTNATASWRNPTDAWNNAAENFDCVVEFNAGAEYDWAKLCTVMAHELGHLLGRQHAAAPDDVMAPLYTTPLAACAQTPDPAAPPAAAPEPEAEPETVTRAVADAPAPRRTAPRPRRASRSVRAACARPASRRLARSARSARAARCRAARRMLRRVR